MEGTGHYADLFPPDRYRNDGDGMELRDGFVYMTKQEICDTNINQRIKLALDTYGPLTANQMAYLAVGGTFGEKVSRIYRACYKLRKRGEITDDNRIWRLK